ncbi:MAG: hypothetical protein QME51_00175 [Planctomycetota bacterium]|nr:hypothetical protein [Planctomycetota bacterium]MDI6786775.1 hypothetical protein [Planctomycetota bacterium]
MEYKVVTPAEPNYPKKLKERLGKDAPGKLYYNGPLEFLDKFTFTTISSDKPVGAGIRAFWDPLFTIMEYEMNHISGWYSVVETEMFMRALFTGYTRIKTNKKYHNFVTLFSAKGLAKESYEDFLLYRFYPPFDKIPVRDEYFRRAENGELLMLSITEPDVGRQLRRNIMERNFISCALADLVYIPHAPKGSKTYVLAKRVLNAGIPVFTVTRELLIENRVHEWAPEFDCLHKLDVAGYNRKTIKDLLEKQGAKLYVPSEPQKEIIPDNILSPNNNRFDKPLQYDIPLPKIPMVKEPSQRNISFGKKRHK